MTSASAFDPADLELLITRYKTPANGDEPRRPPWTWAALDVDERLALARMIDVWATTYNHTHVTYEDDLVPPCWRQHPSLAHELAVQVWLWYWAHMDTTTTAGTAGDYYGRHLPGFQSRLDALLGRSPAECRMGRHVSPREPAADERLDQYDQMTTDQDTDDNAVTLLGQLHFGFSHLVRE